MLCRRLSGGQGREGRDSPLLRRGGTHIHKGGQPGRYAGSNSFTTMFLDLPKALPNMTAKRSVPRRSEEAPTAG